MVWVYIWVLFDFWVDVVVNMGKVFDDVLNFEFGEVVRDLIELEMMDDVVDCLGELWWLMWDVINVMLKIVEEILLVKMFECFFDVDAYRTV